MRPTIPFSFCFIALLLPIAVFGQATVGLTQPNNGGYGGYTLVAPVGGKDTYLIDECGRVVNVWHSDFNPGIVTYLLEDGSLLRSCRIPNQVGVIGGGRVERRDWDDNVLWSFYHTGANYRQHHDIRMMPNGHVLLLARENKTKAECIAKGRNPALVGNNGLQMEYIVEVEPIGVDSGVIVWEWHMWDHLIQDFDSTKPDFGVISDHPERLNMNASAAVAADWIHSNAVHYNPALDQIVLNSRNQNEFWILDHGTTSLEAASHAGGSHGRGGDFLYRWGNPANYGRGTVNDQQLWLQHDAQWIAPGLEGAGQIMVFNNGDGRPAGQYSTVVTIETPVDAQGDYPLSPGQAWGPSAPAWVYQAPNPTDFYSFNISGAQRLPNGNTHICEGANGRIFEIDTTGNIVWEYIVPLSTGAPIAQGSIPTNNSTFRSYRYGADYPGLQGHDLTPGDRIELNPLPLTPACLASSQTPSDLGLAACFPNPIQDHLEIQATLGAHYALYDVLGKPMLSGQMPANTIRRDATTLPAGIYLLQVQSAEGTQTFRLSKQ